MLYYGLEAEIQSDTGGIAMTMEEYVEKVLSENPDFVEDMNKRLQEEYAEQIKAAQKEYSDKMAAAEEAWTKNRGHEVFLENRDVIAQRIAAGIGRYCYLKRIELSGDRFEVEIDLLNGSWEMVPV